MKYLAELMGFRSIKAFDFCKKASGHHKSWSLLKIVLDAILPELIHPYVNEARSMGLEPTAAGYFHWVVNVQNPNYIFCKVMIFGPVLAVYFEDRNKVQ